MQLKRVLVFSLNYYPRFIGGAEVAIKEITDRLPKDQYEFHLVTLRFDSDLPKTEVVGGVTVHRIGFTKKNPSIGDLKQRPLHWNKYLWQVWGGVYGAYLVGKYNIDTIWAMMAHSCGIPAGICKTLRPRVKYVLTLQEGDPTEYIEAMMKPVWGLFRRGFTKATMLQPISTFLLKWGQRMGAACPAVVIPNAVNTGHFSAQFSESDLASFREKIQKTPEKTVLITTSRLVHKNACDDVIRALALLPKHVTFAICGIGPDEEMLRALVKKEGVEDRVHFIGQIGHADMPKFLKAADIFIRPSRSEGMGNSFVEAMAAELPVIATQEGGLSDFIFDDTVNPDKPMTAWAVRKDSPEDIARAVERIMAAPEKVKEVKQTALALVRKSFDWDDIAMRMDRDIFHA